MEGTRTVIVSGALMSYVTAGSSAIERMVSDTRVMLALATDASSRGARTAFQPPTSYCSERIPCSSAVSTSSLSGSTQDSSVSRSSRARDSPTWTLASLPEVIRLPAQRPIPAMGRMTIVSGAVMAFAALVAAGGTVSEIVSGEAMS